MSARMPTAAELDEAVRLLEAGQLVAFPTETVYGLGADAENPAAVARIFAAKGRPSNHPVIVHVVDGGDVSYWTDEVPEAASKLIDAFWPGPLTIILKRAAHIPADVAGGQDSIGLRCPSHPVAQALLARFKRGRGGIAAPSANKFGQVSPTTAEHVRDEFGGDVYVLEGDGVDVGIESSIVDLSRLDTAGPVLLRPGAITAQMMADVLGTVPLPPDAAAPRASGTLKAHYAPRTTLTLATADGLPAYLEALPEGGRLAYVGQKPAGADPRCVYVQAPATPDAYAQALYGLLRRLDKEGYQRLVFEPVPATHEWDGVRDRLGRAAAAFEEQ
ncbi:L-threonylcarbamoyladenylate synthase [Cupriavidus sp. SZY C1]|uniref:L-threonylcarbamoyladenylate synthase n=1 Tax=Cupriavidus sp. SZY C1 TaxID=3055037 RepID=UPI0028BA8C30|nr:L-threonylcarbamoyladenylate synthase [Cupriavidus sp. SZY C1]MDT6962627.1 L-threonylcarbamoyladenylate synthase [Cupriavidus sp. SZY C1]